MKNISSNNVEFLKELNEELSKVGYVHLSSPTIRITTICNSLGAILRTNEIKLDNSKNRLYNSESAIPYHSDHPAARIIVWKCKNILETEGEEMYLIDLAKIIQQINANQIFKETLFHVPLFEGIKYPTKVPLLTIEDKKSKVFFVRWLLKKFPSEKHEKVFNQLEQRLSHASDIIIPLRKKDILIVDNHRMLHGRKEISRISKRHLTRYWIR